MATDDPCAGIADVIEKCGKRAEDSFWVFSRVHYCICSRVAGSGRLAELNAQFAQKLVDVYQAFMQDELERLPREWQQALSLYKERPKNYMVVLLRMAYAHIHCDLYKVLLALHADVSESDFDGIYEDIVFCIEEIGSPYTRTTLGNQIVARFYDSAAPARNFTIRTLRTRVYKQAQRDRAKRQERIRQRAHDIYLARGCAPGHEWDDWLQAEREEEN
jgi:hypothetical protein